MPLLFVSPTLTRNPNPKHMLVQEVDEQYCISYVFKGDWKAKLRGQGQIISPDGGSLTKVTVKSDDINEDGEEKVGDLLRPHDRRRLHARGQGGRSARCAAPPHALLRARATPPHPCASCPCSESASQDLRGFWRDVGQARQFQRERRHGRGQLFLLLPLRVRAPPLSAHTPR